MGPDDLVLCSGTLRRGTSFADRLDAAASAGFTGVSLWGRDYAAARAEGLRDADLRSMLDDHGLVVGEVDPAWWWLPGASEVHIPPELDGEDLFRFGEVELFSVAEAVGARSVNAVDVFGGPWDLDAASEAFAGLCRRADEFGLLVHLEWLPWSQIPDLATALEIVEHADQPNGGLTVDAWHLFRSGTDLHHLATVPGPRILAVQLSDGPLAPEANLPDAALHDRRLPGDGEFDLAGLVDALRVSGTSAPIGVEVFSDDLDERSPNEAAHRAAAATRQILSGGS
jgi:sugar phosphate isomerase/epimerase